MWSIGSDTILKDLDYEGRKSEIEVKILNYLSKHTDLPVPKVIRNWIDSNGRYFVMTHRIPGSPLEDVWDGLDEERRISIANQVVDILHKLRSFTSESIQCIDGKTCYPSLLFFDLSSRGPFDSDDEMWTSLIQALSLPENVLANLRKRLPKCNPYTLSHCDLNLGNIMVADGKVTGILDWEYAAYLPVWYGYVAASIRFTVADGEWKRLLQERMCVRGQGHEETKAFWRVLWNLRTYPELDEKGKEVLERLS